MEEFTKDDYDVLICDGNRTPLGTGVLLAPEGCEDAYILTVAHLFWNKSKSSKEEMTLNIYSSFLRNRQYKDGNKANLGRIGSIDCSIYKTGQTIADEEDSVILIPADYVPEDERSAYDFAVIRVERREWMDEMKPFFFAKKFERNINLKGEGYPKGADIERVGPNGDFFDARLPFKGVTEYMDEHIPKITVTHTYADTVNLEGYSGTGLFDEQGRLYGVVSRKVGNDEAPNACIISSWKGFEELLGVFGWKAAADAAEEDVLDIDLKVQGHWLLNRDAKPNGLMDDQEVVNLASLLLGMTDAYAVILATTWKNGIAPALEKMLHEFAGKNVLERGQLPFPKWKESAFLNYSAQKGEGVVVNIPASRLDILPRIEEILIRHESEETPLIVNIWSEKPAKALETIASIYSNPKLQCRADFISMIDYDAKLDSSSFPSSKVLRDFWEELEGKGTQEKIDFLLSYKDLDTGLWWNCIAEFARYGAGEENFIGYRIAQSSTTAVQRWLSVQTERKLQELFKEELLFRLFEQREIDSLAVHLWRFVSKLSDNENFVWEYCLQQMREYCSCHTAWLIDVLEGESEIKDVMDRLSLEDIRIWSDLVKPPDFEREIGEISSRQEFYWIAIMRNVNGWEYVMRERLKQSNQRFISRLLNRDSEKESDPCMETRAAYIRGYIRAK